MKVPREIEHEFTKPRLVLRDEPRLHEVLAIKADVPQLLAEKFVPALLRDLLPKPKMEGLQHFDAGFAVSTVATDCKLREHGQQVTRAVLPPRRRIVCVP